MTKPRESEYRSTQDSKIRWWKYVFQAQFYLKIQSIILPGKQNFKRLRNTTANLAAKYLRQETFQNLLATWEPKVYNIRKC